MVRDKPQSSLLDVREEAISWSLEKNSSHTRIAKSRKVMCDNVCQVNQGTNSSKD